MEKSIRIYSEARKILIDTVEEKGMDISAIIFMLAGEEWFLPNMPGFETVPIDKIRNQLIKHHSEVLYEDQKIDKIVNNILMGQKEPTHNFLFDKYNYVLICHQFCCLTYPKIINSLKKNSYIGGLNIVPFISLSDVEAIKTIPVAALSTGVALVGKNKNVFIISNSGIDWLEEFLNKLVSLNKK